MKKIFNIKSYLKFLSRNKAYTFIDVFGLSLSLMFVILIGVYYMNERSVDDFQTKGDRIYSLGFTSMFGTSTGGHWGLQSKLMNRYPEIESTCAVSFKKTTIKNANNEVIPTNWLLTDSTFLKLFDFKLLEGDRTTALDAPNKVLMTEACARRFFGPDDAMGKTIVYNDSTSLVVSGIIEPLTHTSICNEDRSETDMVVSFDLMKYFDFFASKESKHLDNMTGSDIYLECHPNTNIESKLADMKNYFKSFYDFYNLPGNDVDPKLISLNKQYFSDYDSSGGNHINGDKKTVKILFTVGLVILIFAIMNYINLTIALGGFRAKEMATRRLLGSSRIDVILKLIIESTLLCGISCAVGIFLAYFFAPYASNLLQSKLVLTDYITPMTIIILIAIILFLGICSGLFPALVISSAKPIDVVRGTFRRKSKMIFSKIFITFQNTITIIMIACSLTMVLQIIHLIKAPLGYDTENLIVIDNPHLPNVNTFVSELRNLACVKNVSKAYGTPYDGGYNNTFIHNGNTISVQTVAGDENYMNILGISLEKDYHSTNKDAVYVNHQLLNEMGLKDDARSFPFPNENGMLSIGGILNDFTIFKLDHNQHPVIVRVFTQIENPDIFLVKVTGNSVEAYKEVSKVYKEVFNLDLSIANPYLEQKIIQTYESEIRLSKIVILFALIAIVISLLGLLAMSTYFIQQRKKEVAIRKVFGCESSEVLLKLIRSFLIYVVVAFIVAIPVVYYFMTDWLSNYSYRINLSWWIYAIAGIFCLLISFFTVLIQSYQAANANPIESLKQR